MYEITLNDGGCLLVPSVGEECPLDQLVKICHAFGRHTAAEWLMDDPPLKTFVFDGCSGPAPDDVNGKDFQVPCLLHNISYYAADPFHPFSSRYRALTDYQFAQDLINVNAPVELVDAFVFGVRTGGAFWPGAQWGYGRER